MPHDPVSPVVSIIVPCYNHGKYIDDMLGSVERIGNKDIYELIIVNDGSTDEFTNKKLREVADAGYHVIFQQNAGLATSRNNAIKASKGKYILPLDADNMIRPEYVYKGIKILDSMPGVSVVYGNSMHFGEASGVHRPGPYNLQKLMITNYIDACAIYRRQVWEATGGYDKDMPSPGLEDWEIWLHASFLGYRFKYIDETLFDYRVLGTSMIRDLHKSKIKGSANQDYMINKHREFLGPDYIDADIMQKFGVSPSGFIGKLMLKKYFPARFEKLVQQGKLRKYI